MVELQKTIQKYWKERAGKNAALAPCIEFLKGNTYKALELGYVAVFNPLTESLEAPLFQAPVPKAESSFDEEIMALTDAKPTHDFDFIGANQEKIMCFVDIPNETVIEKEETKEEEKESGEHNLELNVSEGVHPILMPIAPLCPGHVIFPMNCDQALTQELSDDILTILLQIFATTTNPTLKIGYNSLGAGSTVNQLHFHLLFADLLYHSVPDAGNADALLPIELADKLPFYETTLQHKDTGEFDLFSIGVILMETFSFPLPTIILQPRDAITKDNMDQAQESMSHVCAAITDILTVKGIAYNLLITDKGMTFYITPRRKDSEIPDNIYNLGVFDIAGVCYVLKKEFFEKMNYKDFFEYCKSSVGLPKEQFLALKGMIKEKFESEYKGVSNE